MKYRHFFTLFILLIFIAGTLFPAGFVFGAMYQNINSGGDQTIAPASANFESGEAVWVNNTFVVRTRAGGTGVLRSLQLTTGATNVGLVVNSSGNVGIGTTAPVHPLQVNTAVNADPLKLLQTSTYDVGINLSRTGGTASWWEIYTPSGTTDLRLYSNSLDRVTFKNDGNVGIGTTAPSGVLDLGQPTSGRALSWGGTTNNYQNIWAAYSNADLVMGVGLRGTTATADGYVSSYGGSIGRSAIRLSYAGGLRFFTDAASIVADGTAVVPTERMTILNNGNVGIGTSIPSYKLDVVGTSQFSQPVIVGTPTAVTHATTKSYVDSMFTGSGQWTTNGGLVYLTSTTQNVGIGTTGPSEKLTVASAGKIAVYRSGNDRRGLFYTDGQGTWLTSDSAGNDPLYLQSPGTTGYINFIVAGTQKATIDYNGNVGIGTTGPGALLHVSSVGTTKIRLSATAGGTSDFDLQNDWSGSGQGAGFGIYDNTNSLMRLKITPTGNVGIGTTGPIGKLQIGANTLSGANGVYDNSRIGTMVNGVLTSMVYASTYNDPTYPDYGLVFIHASSTSNYNVWSLSPDGPAKGNGLNFIYQANATNIHTQTPKVVFKGDGNVGIATTTPSYKLDVVGTSQFSQPVIVGTPTAVTHATTKSYVDSMFTGSGQWTTSGGLVYLTSTTQNVGIGTTGPNAKLEITGGAGMTAGWNRTMMLTDSYPGIIFNSTAGAKFAGINYDGTSVLNIRVGASSNDIYASGVNAISINATNGNTSVGGSALYAQMNGNVGIGTTTPGAKLEVNGNIRSSTGYYEGSVYNYFGPGTTFGVGLTFTTSPVNSYYTDILFDGNNQNDNTRAFRVMDKGVERMRVNGAGNVGIGTSTPSYKLDVVGTSQFSQPVIVGTPTAVTHATTKSYVDSMFTGSGQWTTNGGLVYLTSTTQNVGIGTTGPGYKLDVNGEINIPDGNWYRAGGLSALTNYLGNTWLYAGSSKDVSIYAGAAEKVTIKSTGNVGIGTTGPGAKLEVKGAINNWGIIHTNSLGNKIGGFYEDNNNNGVIYQLTSAGAWNTQISASGITYFNGGNVGIGTSTPSYALTVNGYGWFNQPVIVGTPTNAGHAATKSYVDSIVGGGAGAGSFTTLAVSGTSTLSGNLWLTGAMYSNLNMNGKNILGVNKITASMVDPLYQIDNIKYSTFGVSTAGAVYEEYIGRGKLMVKSQITNNKCQTNIKDQNSNTKNDLGNLDFENSLSSQGGSTSGGKTGNCDLEIGGTAYEYIIDFSKVSRGSDLWVWYNVVDFGSDTVNVITTPLNVPANVFYTIEGQKIIFKAIINDKLPITNNEIQFSYRLSGKRHDWKEWPIKANDQSEEPSFKLISK